MSQYVNLSRCIELFDLNEGDIHWVVIWHNQYYNKTVVLIGQLMKIATKIIYYCTAPLRERLCLHILSFLTYHSFALHQEVLKLAAVVLIQSLKNINL